MVMSNGAKRAPQEMRIDFAVLSVAACQGLIDIVVYGKGKDRNV